MYPMREFQETDREAILAFIRQHPLALVTSISKEGRIEATHVPLLLTVDGESVRLRGHVMRKTAHWQAFHANSDVFLAFTGPNAPVLESWLSKRGFGGTWNYMAVHARGKLTFLPQETLLDLLRDLKDGYELDPSAKFENLPAGYVSSLIGAIEGFEIEIEKLEAVFKLSQNRNREDFERIVTALRDQGGESALVAAEMEARRIAYYPESR